MQPQPRHLLSRPHHDGSALYVEPGPYRIGDVVPVRFRVPAGLGESGLWVREVHDGEPHVVEARLDRSDEHERWYVAQVRVHNPVTPYRALVGLRAGFAWLTGTGLHAREVEDAADFRLSVYPPAPPWTSDAVVYQVFPDRFARHPGTPWPPDPVPAWAQPMAWDDAPAADGRSAGRQLYGGDLPGLAGRLDHLVRLGVDTVYRTPVFPGRSSHRYDATTFEHVDPLLGGDAAMAALSGVLHERGMRLIGDLTTNHTGREHEWFVRGRADRAADEARYYYWTDDEPGYVGWLGHPTLPKLSYRDPALLHRMAGGADSVVARWLAPPYRFDGWRIDVGNMTGRHGEDDFTPEVARAVRAAMSQVNPDTVLVAEHFFDAAADLRVGGWQAAMNYHGFARPAWEWLGDPASGLRADGLPVPLPHRPAAAMVAAMVDAAAAVPWTVVAHQWNLLGSHDTPRIRTLTGSAGLVEVGAGLLFTYPGTPMVFAGDEGGLTGLTGEHGRVPMPWDEIDAGGGPRWDAATFEVYRRLIAMRRGSRALREGGLRWAVVADDAVAYLRELPDERVLVLLARAPWAGARLPRQLLAPGAEPEQLYGDGALGVGADALHLPGDGPGVQVWRLASR